MGRQNKIKAKNKLRIHTEIFVVSSIEDINKQIDYKWIAMSTEDKKYRIGYIYIDMPCFSPEDQWEYYLKYQINASGYDCQYWEDCMVYKQTIIPYTKKNKTWLNSKRGIKTLFVKPGYYLNNSEENVLGDNIDIVVKKLSE